MLWRLFIRGLIVCLLWMGSVAAQQQERDLLDAQVQALLRRVQAL